ncbi:MAG: hypothetical protein QOI21_3031 [Actinomycetota bacterium]|jgi:hypothetical protein|nr:hypothetical protein [Actinomycetota bacterium]
MRLTDDLGVGFAPCGWASQPDTGSAGAGATLHYDGSVGDRRLRRLPALPAKCTEVAPTGARATFDVFWQTCEENYPFFEAKKIDWRAVRDRYRPRVYEGMPDTEFFAVLREMVLPLYDAHAGIDAGDTGGFGQSRPGTVVPGPGLDQQSQGFVERHDLAGMRLQTFARGRIGYAQLPDGTGYLRISGIGGYDANGPTGCGRCGELSRSGRCVPAWRRPRTGGRSGVRRPAAEYLTPSGKTFDGEGIPPDIRTGNFPEVIAKGTHDSAFSQALEVLRRHAE